MDEGVDVWRPVEAERPSQAVDRLSHARAPEDELWSFGPGEVVVAEARRGEGAQTVLVAVARASDLDRRSRTALSSAV